MALLPYTLIDPTGEPSPFIIGSPHSGRIYPADFDYACPLPLLRQAEDAYVDELVTGASQAGATVVMAEFPRSMIDVNRAETDIDPAAIDGAWPVPLAPDAMTLRGFGLVRRLCRNGVLLYRAPLKAAEAMRRIETYYRPYHEGLRSLVQMRLAQQGVCYLLDMHSMSDRFENGISRPDFVLGDRDGTSCDPAFTRRVQRILQDMGYRVVLNDPYKGREIMRRYGATGAPGTGGAQALQIEINRKLYLDEINIEKSSGFARLREDLTEFFRLVSASVVTDSAAQLAAE
ncbi:MAG: N-formylglutamate amidohydrolase [Alphaproteobacteria bacterium]|nr:N-formylglutamate amidohydrolase [Alphaproteobacteria bacterium]